MTLNAPKYIFVLKEDKKLEYRLFLDYSKAVNSDIWEYSIENI